MSGKIYTYKFLFLNGKQIIRPKSLLILDKNFLFESLFYCQISLQQSDLYAWK